METSVEFFGIVMQSPVTVFTDLIVSTVCFYEFYKLNQISDAKKVIVFLIIIFLSWALQLCLEGF